MSFLTDSKGNLSFIRLSILIATFGGLFVIGGIITFMMDQQSRRAPLNIDLPEGAATWGYPSQVRNGHQILHYRVFGADPEAIAQFYQSKMYQHYGTSSGDQRRESCIRTPAAGRYTSDPNDTANTYVRDFEPGPEYPPYFWKCMFDRSGLSSTQDTLVTIYPGAKTDDPLSNSEGAVVIIYEQRWQTD